MVDASAQRSQQIVAQAQAEKNYRLYITGTHEDLVSACQASGQTASYCASEANLNTFRNGLLTGLDTATKTQAEQQRALYQTPHACGDRNGGRSWVEDSQWRSWFVVR